MRPYFISTSNSLKLANSTGSGDGLNPNKFVLFYVLPLKLLLIYLHVFMISQSICHTTKTWFSGECQAFSFRKKDKIDS